MGSVEVITAVQRKRRCSAEENKTLALEAEQPEMSISGVAKKYGFQLRSLASNDRRHILVSSVKWRMLSPNCVEC